MSIFNSLKNLVSNSLRRTGKFIKETSRRIFKKNLNSNINNTQRILNEIDDDELLKASKYISNNNNRPYLEKLVNIENNIEVNLTLNELKRIIKVLNINERYLLTINNRIIPLNNENFNRIKEIILNNGIIEINENQYSSDITEFFIDLSNAEINNLSLRKIPNGERRRNTAGLFKYLHKTDLNLKRYQIYNKIEDFKNYEHCFIHCIKNTILKDVLEEQLNEINEEVRQLNLTNLFKFLKNNNDNLINNSIKLNITTFDKYYNKKKIKKFGNGNKIVNLSIIEDHIFIDELTDITHHYFKKDKNKPRLLKSTELIQKLIKNDLIEPLYGNDLENVNFHITNDFNIREIKFNNYNNRKVIYKPINSRFYNNKKKINENFDVYIADTETYIKNGVCIPYTLSYIKYNINDEEKLLEFIKKIDINNNKINEIKDKDKIIELKKENKKILIEKQEYEKKILKKNTYYGKDNIINFFKNMDNKNNLVMFHNLGFDFTVLINSISLLKNKNIYNYIENGTKIKSVDLEFINNNKKIHVKFQDSYAYFLAPLKSLSKMFNLNCFKDIFPYNAINENNLNSIIDYKECLNYIKKKDKNKFINRYKNINFDVKNETIKYCEKDVEVLFNAIIKYKYALKKETNLDLYNYISNSQIAYNYILKEGCLEDTYEYSGNILNFISSSIVGGQCMSNLNKKYYIDSGYDEKLEKKISKNKDTFYIPNTNLCDLDVNSLYPTAMKPIPKGRGKIWNSSIDLSKVDEYIIEIKILEYYNNQDFPILSIKNKITGVRDFTNDVINKNFTLTKTTINNLIKTNNIKYEIIKGLYWDEGFNDKIKETINNMYNLRIKYKKLDNPIQNVYKLLMNSIYGKMIQKPIKKTTLFLNKDNVNTYLFNNYHQIIDGIKVNDYLYKINIHKSYLKCQFRSAHIGSFILSESKSIMRKFLDICYENNIKVYYMDTDSLHMDLSKMELFFNKYYEKYNINIKGKNLGQLSTDLKNDNCKINKSIILGKKSYYHCIIDTKENKKYNHFRLKGIPNNLLNSGQYFNLINGEKYEFDLKSSCVIQRSKNMEFKETETFKRIIKF